MNLADLRRRAELSQLRAAVELDVTQSAISVWERGLNPPLGKYRKKLCQMFDCTMEELEAAIEESRRRRP